MVDPTLPQRSALMKMAGSDQRLLIALERLFQVSGEETPGRVDVLETLTAELLQRTTLEEMKPDTGASALDLLMRYTRGLSSEKLVFVADKYDFPAASGGVITLDPGVTYQIVGDVDLEGDRLAVGGEKVSLIGLTQESSFLRSTGLASGTALLSSEYTLPVNFLSFTANTVLDLDASANADQALDWSYVNFVDCPEIGVIKSFGNFIGNTIGILNSEGLTFDGSIGTVGLSNTIFAGDGSGVIVDLPSTLTITRRFRVAYSAIVSFGSSTAFNVDAGATIPTEGLIFDTCNFSGGATYIAGAAETDVVSLWVNNVGIPNIASTAWAYMFGNSTATAIGAANTPVKVAGATTAQIEARFDASATSNRAEYIGEVSARFKVTGTASFTGTASDQATIYIAKNGAIEAASAVTVNSGVGGKVEAIPIFAIVELENSDYVEVWIENNSAARNFTVTDLNFIVEKSG